MFGESEFGLRQLFESKISMLCQVEKIGTQLSYTEISWHSLETVKLKLIVQVYQPFGYIDHIHFSS